MVPAPGPVSSDASADLHNGRQFVTIQQIRAAKRLRLRAALLRLALRLALGQPESALPVKHALSQVSEIRTLQEIDDEAGNLRASRRLSAV